MHLSLPSAARRSVLVLLLAGVIPRVLFAAPDHRATGLDPLAGPRTTGWTVAQEGMPTLNGAAFGASTYVVVGDYGEIWTSPDGTAWTKQLVPTSEAAYGVTFGGGQFVAVGRLGTVLTSPDGVVWTLQGSPVSSFLYGVIFGGGQYVAVGTGGSVITSPDGVTWTQQTSNTTQTLHAVTYGGGLFVAVGDNREVITSPDGVTWTVRTPGVPPTISTLYGVAHGAGVFVAAGSPGLITSPDGITWTQTSSSGSFRAVTHTGTLFVVVGVISIRTSPDGTTWTPSSLNPAPGVSRYLNAVTFGSGGVLAAGWNGSIFTSPDGATPWTSHTLEASRALYAAASDGNALCAVGGGEVAQGGPASRSADGLTWTNGAGLVYALSSDHGNGLYVAVGETGIMTSPDCLTWTIRSFTPPGSVDTYFLGVAFAGGRFVAVGLKFLNGTPSMLPLLATSPDGIVWTEVDSQLPANDDGALSAIGHGSGLWVAAGTNYNTGEVYLTTSPDGITWTRQTPTGIPVGNNPTDIAYGNGIFALAGSQIFSSSDAINWTLRVNDAARDVVYGANQFVAVSSVGNPGAYSSPDGITWSFAPSPSVHAVSSVGYSLALDRFVIAGDSVILYADAVLHQVSIGDVSVGEGNSGSTNASFSVTLSPSSAQTVSVGYVTADGTATAGSDYTAVAGMLSFAPGTTLQTIDVPVLGDTTVELDEMFLVNLGAAVNATVADGQGVGTIINDDVPTVSIGDVSVAEGSSGTTNASFSVTLSGSSPVTVSVGYATADGTATAGSDYTATSGTLTFAPGDTTTMAIVPVVGDTVVEVDETFFVNLSSPTNATLGDAQGTAYIIDDDAVSLSQDELIHGSQGSHDLAAQPGPVADVDYYRIAQRPRSSYEVLIDGTSADVVPVIAERLAADNVTVLQTGAPVAGGASVSLRFRNDLPVSITNQTISVRSGGCTTTCNASAAYRLRSYDTTYAVARFNNSGTQVTVVVLQNTADSPVAGSLWFWNTAGALAGSSSFSIAAHGTLTLNTATVVPSTGGTITLSNDGRYGALSGKAVAVEPATGFTFDTPLLPRVR